MEISKLLEEIAGYMDFSSISANRPQDENSYDHLKNCHDYDQLAEVTKTNNWQNFTNFFVSCYSDYYGSLVMYTFVMPFNFFFESLPSL